MVFVYTHAQYKRQLAAYGMHQSLRSTYRAQKIAEAATTFCEDTKDDPEWKRQQDEDLEIQLKRMEENEKISHTYFVTEPAE